MPMIQSRMLLAVFVLLLLSRVGLGASQPAGEASPTDLIKAVIRNELNSPQKTDIRWSYRSEREVDGKQETREVVETKSGSLNRLVAVGGKPLTEAQQRHEADRILRVSRNADEQRKLEQTHQKDLQQCNSFLQMIPDAFLFEYAGTSGELTKVTFRPNPSFQPPSFEGKILHQMSGEIWVDAKQERLASIDGQLLNDVKLAGGLLGHLEKGGQFVVKRAEIAPDHWESVEITVNMRGKALLFKTIAVQQKERRSNFQSVPDDLTLSDAAGLLLKELFIAER